MPGWVGRWSKVTSLLNCSLMPRSVKSHNTNFHSRAWEAASPPGTPPFSTAPAGGQAIEHVKTGIKKPNKQHYHNAAVAHLKFSCLPSLCELSSIFVICFFFSVLPFK